MTINDNYFLEEVIIFVYCIVGKVNLKRILKDRVQTKEILPATKVFAKAGLDNVASAMAGIDSGSTFNVQL